MPELKLNATSIEIDAEINAELARAGKVHQPLFYDTMQAFGVITEEYNEVAECFHKSKDKYPEGNTKLRVELIQLAAMCKKAVMSCCLHREGNNFER